MVMMGWLSMGELLATLGIMIGLFAVAGFINRMRAALRRLYGRVSWRLEKDRSKNLCTRK